MKFTKGLSVHGNLLSSFVFDNEDSRAEWIINELPKLEKEHGALKLYRFDLPGLEVGDKCHVSGEGDDVFIIEELICYSPDRYGFVLDSGYSEEVAKCY